MINQSRALCCEPAARSMKHLQVLLLDRFLPAQIALSDEVQTHESLWHQPRHSWNL